MAFEVQFLFLFLFKSCNISKVSVCVLMMVGLQLDVGSCIHLTWPWNPSNNGRPRKQKKQASNKQQDETYMNSH